ncbi:hypothetical protein [Herbaspirillum robiniae]|uniref:hypothetical protein n=1 Tax=Herbaspirillum robiniae TaxID=2014887 RepID=UPI00101AEC3A|nr:hypothetical protein [Herbaspirillum robiniae]
MDTRIGKNPKDRRADAKTTAPFLAHSKNLEELRETLVFFTEHSKNPTECNLTSFRDGYSAPDDPLYHSGRPALISELFYALYDQVVYNAASSIVTLRWSLHNWWRVMDHVELELPSHPKVSSVADLTEIHWQVALQLNIPGKAYYAFLKAVNVTRRALGKTEFTWRGPDPDSNRMDRSTGKKIVPPLWQGDLIRHELKHRWFHTLRKFEYFDALRLSRMPLIQKEDAPAIRRQERKILRWISDYEEWNPSLPPVKRDCTLRESATAYRQNICDLAIDSKGIYQGFFPNQDDVKNAFHLCLANYGLNVATLLSIDVSQDMLVPHPKDSNRFVFTGIKDRADGEPQYVEGLFKSQGGLGFILTFLIKRTAPLRTELFNRLRNCKEEYVRLLKHTRAEDTDLHDLKKEIFELEAGVRSPWLFQRHNEICWLHRDNYAKGVSGKIYLRSLIEDINSRRKDKQQISNLTAKQFRDLFTNRIYFASGGSILTVKARLNHRSPHSTDIYLRNTVIRAEHWKTFMTFSNALWSEIRKRGEIDPTILAKMVYDGQVSDQERARLRDHRNLEKSRLGIGCLDPHNPPNRIAPNFVADGKKKCSVHRCVLCYENAVLLRESIDGLCQRLAELEYLERTMGQEAYLLSSFPEEMENINVAFLGYKEEDIAEGLEKWRTKISSGEHRFFDFNS